ncbi:hypothetical protein YC2023_117162 [Brassica napus]
MGAVRLKQWLREPATQISKPSMTVEIQELTRQCDQETNKNRPLSRRRLSGVLYRMFGSEGP